MPAWLWLARPQCPGTPDQANQYRQAHGLSVALTACEELSGDAQVQLEVEFAEIGRFLETGINWSLTLDRDAAKSG